MMLGRVLESLILIESLGCFVRLLSSADHKDSLLTSTGRIYKTIRKPWPKPKPFFLYMNYSGCLEEA